MSEAASSPRRAFGQDAVEEIMARVLEAQAEAYEQGPYSDAPRQRREAVEQRIRQLVDENERMREALEELDAVLAFDKPWDSDEATFVGDPTELNAAFAQARAALLRSEGKELEG
jgi:hypothetical protein